MVDVVHNLLLSSHLLVLEGPKSLVLLDVLLVLATKGQEEVVKELVTDQLLLVTHLPLNNLALLDFLFSVDLTVLLTVLGLQLLQGLGIEDVVRARSEFKLAHVRNLLNAG